MQIQRVVNYLVSVLVEYTWRPFLGQHPTEILCYITQPASYGQTTRVSRRQQTTYHRVRQDGRCYGRSHEIQGVTAFSGIR